MRWPLAFLLAALFVGGCNTPPPPTTDEHGHDHDEHEHEGEEEGHVELSEDSLSIGGVELATVSYQEIEQTIQVPGTVSSTSKGRAVVTPPAAGRVISINVQPGDIVQAGQTLATIESPEVAQAWASIAEARRMRDAANADIKQAKSEVLLAKAKLAAAQTSLSRQRELAKAGAFSQAPLQQAQNELNEAQSELLSIQKEQAIHAEQLRRLENLFREGIVSKSELDAARLEAQQDEIRLDRAQARIDIAKSAYEREKNISSQGLLIAKELQTAEAEVRASQLEVDRAQIRVRSSEAAAASANRAVSNAQSIYRANSGAGKGSVGRVSLVAPIAGTIAHLDITRGQAVDRTQVLMEIENLKSVWVTANVTEKDAAKVRKGARVRLTTSSLPEQEFLGIVQVVGTRLDPKTRTLPIQCLVTEAGGRLKPEMFATVRIGTAQVTSALVIPKSAIVYEKDVAFVFVQHDGDFEKVEVKLGVEQEGRAAVTSGLSEGDKIASKGAFVLNSQQKKDELKGHEH